MAKEKESPSVNYAYEFSRQSCDLAIKRLDAIDNTIASFTGWVTGINVAFIASVLSGFMQSAGQYRSPFNDCVFYSAMLFLLVSIIYAIIVKARVITLITPERLYHDARHFSEREFKERTVNKIFERNRTMADCKRSHLCRINILFFIEIILLVIWIAQLG